MKYIELTRGYRTMVDDSDFEWLSQWRWRALDNGCGQVYAVRSGRMSDGDRIRKTILMHAELTGSKQGQETDHEDHDGLNNQRYNLRMCTPSNNQHNKGKYRNNTSGWKGVCWSKEKRHWHARLNLHGKCIHIGYYDDLVQAAMAYDCAARKYHGAFARTNFAEAEIAPMQLGDTAQADYH